MSNWGSGSSIGRPGQPSEVATTFVFLASPDSALYCRFSLSKLLHAFETRPNLFYRWSSNALLPSGRLSIDILRILAISNSKSHNQLQSDVLLV